MVQRLDSAYTYRTKWSGGTRDRDPMRAKDTFGAECFYCRGRYRRVVDAARGTYASQPPGIAT